jgi:hypothetical protein
LYHAKSFNFNLLPNYSTVSTARFIEAIEAVVPGRRSESQPKEETKPIHVVNPVAAAIAKQEAALRSERDSRGKRGRRSGSFRLV